VWFELTAGAPSTSGTDTDDALTAAFDLDSIPAL
jgi:hypothetical protein